MSLFSDGSIVVTNDSMFMSTGDNYSHQLGIPHEVLEEGGEVYKPVKLLYEEWGNKYFVLFEGGYVYDANAKKWLMFPVVEDGVTSYEKATGITDIIFGKFLANGFDPNSNYKAFEAFLIIKGSAKYNIGYIRGVEEFWLEPYTGYAGSYILGTHRWTGYYVNVYSDKTIEVVSYDKSTSIITLTNVKQLSIEEDGMMELPTHFLTNGGTVYTLSKDADNNPVFKVVGTGITRIMRSRLEIRNMTWGGLNVQVGSSLGYIDNESGEFVANILNVEKWNDVSSAWYPDMLCYKSGGKYYVTGYSSLGDSIVGYDPYEINQYELRKDIIDETIDQECILTSEIIMLTSKIGRNNHVYSNNFRIGVGVFELNTVITTLNTVLYEYKKVPDINTGNSVSTSSDYSLFLMNNGTVGGCGVNSDNQLGNKLDIVKEVTHIPRLNNVIQVSAGHCHSLFLLSDGTVMGCGNNEYNQLGNVEDYIQSTINTINLTNGGVSLQKAIQVEAGYYNSFILLEDGSVLRAGYNQSGLLGNASSESISTFNKIENIPPIKNISLSDYFALLVSVDGDLFVAGRNHSYQLGLETNGLSLNQFVQVHGITGVDVAKCGYDFSLLLMKDGTVMSAGSNEVGQTGLSDTDTVIKSFTTVPSTESTPISQIATGRAHSIFVARNGTVIGNGSSNNGQLGLSRFSVGRYINKVLFITNVKNLWNWFKVVSVDGKLFAKVGGTWVKVKVCFGKKNNVWNKSNKLLGKKENKWR